MKKFFLLLTISILLQSCFSYKRIAIDPSKMVSGQKYKIKQNNKISEVTLKRVSDSSIVVMKNKSEQQILIKDITSIRKRKFSLIKTIAVVPVSVLGFTILYIATNPITFEMGEIEWPN